ncbi:MAG: CoA transferase [Acidimicrobiia bacterium]|nr:CoA transferase [Acidimicrobiia bacterium]
MTGALDGIRVFDLTLAVVGPWATKLLAQMGADVVKVGAPDGELLDFVPPYMGGAQSSAFLDTNLNKRLVALDLKVEADREAAWALLERADVFVENMRPGAADRLGFSYEAASARNPRLVYASACAYGRVGPMATQAGVDPLVQAFSGYASLNGPEGGPGEMNRFLANIDITTASMLVEAVLQALIARERTGRGQKIELTMLGASLAVQATRLADYLATGETTPPRGSASATTAPHEAFRCADEVWLAVGVEREAQWDGLCRALGPVGARLAADDRYATNASRLAHRQPLAEAVAAEVRREPAAAWEVLLGREGVPCGRIRRFDELRHHAQATANGWFCELDTPWGHLCAEGPPWRFSGTPTRPVRLAGANGAHNAEVLAELALHDHPAAAFAPRAGRPRRWARTSERPAAGQPPEEP